MPRILKDPQDTQAPEGSSGESLQTPAVAICKVWRKRSERAPKEKSDQVRLYLHLHLKMCPFSLCSLTIILRSPFLKKDIVCKYERSHIWKEIGRTFWKSPLFSKSTVWHAKYVHLRFKSSSDKNPLLRWDNGLHRNPCNLKPALINWASLQKGLTLKRLIR